MIISLEIGLQADTAITDFHFFSAEIFITISPMPFDISAAISFS
jgi:hypothetical protein